MTTRITFYPAGAIGTPLVLETGRLADPFRLQGWRGTDALAPGLLTAKGAGQEGVTALDYEVPPRVIPAWGIVQVADQPALDAALATLAAAMSVIPVRFGGSVSLGRLLFERPSMTNREIDAAPQSVSTSLLSGADVGLARFDCEWQCPYPYFRDTADTISDDIAPAGSEVVVNGGHVDAPMIARLYGPASSVTLLNATTGESFTVVYTIPDGHYLQVDTTPARKSILHYNGSAVLQANAMSGLDLADARLWLLRPGNNSVEFEAADTGGATKAVIRHRNRYAGL